jgi:prenyltransferase beta subunit
MKHVVIQIFVLLLCTSALPAQTPEQKKATVRYVRDLQAPDGGFFASLTDASPRGSLRATVTGLRALKYFGGEPKDKDAAAKFAKSCWNAEAGAFSDQSGGNCDAASTALGLIAVAELKLPMDDYCDAAIKYMAEHAKEFEEKRMAAAGMEAAGKRAPAARQWLIDLQATANPDGSYGKGAEMARATGGTVAMILRLGGKPVGPTPVTEILDKGQNKDGGFGKDDSGASDLETSYRVMRCYHMLKAKPTRADAMREFVAKCRNADGGYGSAPGQASNINGTYFAAIITHWLKETP